MEETRFFSVFFWLKPTWLSMEHKEEDNTFQDLNHACVLKVAFVPLICVLLGVDPLHPPETFPFWFTPPKTNITLDKRNPLKMYLLSKMVIFHCHLSLLEGRFIFRDIYC